MRVSPDELPAWIQAGAAVLQLFAAAIAVVIAHRIGRGQQQAEREIAASAERARRQAADDANFRLLSSVSGMANLARVVMNDVTDRVGPTGMVDGAWFREVFQQERFDAVQEAIRAIPLYDLGDISLLTGVVRLRAALDSARNDLVNANAAPTLAHADGELRVDLSCAFRASTSVTNAALDVGRRIAELGGPGVPGEPPPVKLDQLLS